MFGPKLISCIMGPSLVVPLVRIIYRICLFFGSNKMHPNNMRFPAGIMRNVVKRNLSKQREQFRVLLRALARERKE